MARVVREYSFNGLAGCVVQKKTLQTGTLVGVYHGVQSGIETGDLEYPWMTVCEAGAGIVGRQATERAYMATLSKAERRKESARKGQKKAMAGRRCPKCNRGNALTKDRTPGWVGKHCRYCDYARGNWI